MAGRAQTKRNREDTADTRGRIPTAFTCPDCEGTLFLVRENDYVRLRCRIGHLYSPESMFAAQSANVERLMWSATRALEEQSEYTRQMAGHVARTSAALARDYQTISRNSHRRAEALRNLIQDQPPQKPSARAKKK